MASSILVTGGTGTLGRLVVPKMRHAGCDVRVLTRNRHDGEEDIEFATGDLSTRRNRSRSRGHRDHRALCWQQQGRQGQGAAPGPGRVACGCAAPGVHLGRWSGQDPGRRRHRPGELLRVQARRRAHRGGLRSSVDDAAALAARQGRPRVPGWREPCSGPCGRPPDLGGLPDRTSELADRRKIRPPASHDCGTAARCRRRPACAHP